MFHHNCCSKVVENTSLSFSVTQIICSLKRFIRFVQLCAFPSQISETQFCPSHVCAHTHTRCTYLHTTSVGSIGLERKASFFCSHCVWMKGFVNVCKVDEPIQRSCDSRSKSVPVSTQWVTKIGRNTRRALTIISTRAGNE